MVFLYCLYSEEFLIHINFIFKILSFLFTRSLDTEIQNWDNSQMYE